MWPNQSIPWCRSPRAVFSLLMLCISGAHPFCWAPSNLDRATPGHQEVSHGTVYVHNLSGFASSSGQLCVAELAQNVYWDSNKFYRMDGFIPESIIGSLLLQVPHEIDWDETFDFVFVGQHGQHIDMFFFWATCSLTKWQKYWHETRDEAAQCYSDFAKQSRALNFSGPQRGPQYDIHSIYGDPPGHGNQSEMWHRKLIFNRSGIATVSFSTIGDCLQTVGFAVKGVNEIVAPNHFAHPLPHPASLSVATFHLPVTTTAWLCQSMGVLFLLGIVGVLVGVTVMRWPTMRSIKCPWSLSNADSLSSSLE